MHHLTEKRRFWVPRNKPKWWPGDQFVSPNQTFNGVWHNDIHDIVVALKFCTPVQLHVFSFNFDKVEVNGKTMKRKLLHHELVEIVRSMIQANPQDFGHSV